MEKRNVTEEVVCSFSLYDKDTKKSKQFERYRFPLSFTDAQKAVESFAEQEGLTVAYFRKEL